MPGIVLHEFIYDIYRNDYNHLIAAKTIVTLIYSPIADFLSTELFCD